MYLFQWSVKQYILSFITSAAVKQHESTKVYINMDFLISPVIY